MMYLEARQFTQRKRFGSIVVLLLTTFVAVGACRESGSDRTRPKVSENHPAATAGNGPGAVQEQPVIEIPLKGDLVSTCGPRCAEVSGLAWHGDELIILPQYPRRFNVKEEPTADGRIFALARERILAYLDGKEREPLEPRGIVFVDGKLEQRLAESAKFDGYEAIAFSGDRAYLTVETRLTGAAAATAPTRAAMGGYVVSGEVDRDGSRLTVDHNTLTPTGPPGAVFNMADEALVVVDGGIMSLYEANGRRVNPRPMAHLFDSGLRTSTPVAFPNIEYRVTDATDADDRGFFWVINFFFPGDASVLNPAADEIAGRYGQGETHSGCKTVERLVRLRYRSGSIGLADTSPILLRLTDDARNWEGIALLEGRGFLVVTDKYPRTLLAFVPHS